MTEQRVEQLSDSVTLYLGDCREILPTLGKVDAVVTDPPYGINIEDAGGRGIANGWNQFEKHGWDKQRPDRAIFDLMLGCSKSQIIWGGNYFTDYLPPTMQWLIWDKGQRNFSLADFEIAWSSKYGASRILAIPRAVALLDGKVHPTQKPIALIAWCIQQIPPPATLILDPFMGSGTTGVAAASLDRKFIGIEIEPKYFDIACRRISEELRKPRLPLIEPPPPLKQGALEL